MGRYLLVLAALACAAAACAGNACAAPPATLRLDAASLAAGGVRTAALRAVARSPRVAAYGVVLDPGPLIRLAAAIAAARSRLAEARAQTALAASQARRATGLYRAQHNVSRADYEAARSRLQVAEAAEAGARARLAEVQAGARSRWGARLAGAAAGGGAPLPQLEQGRWQLVEASVALGGSLPRPLAPPLARLPDGTRARLRVIGRAPRAAAGIAGPGVYCLLAAPTAASIGTPLSVSLRASRALPGVLVPASAVVWHDGRALVYLQRGASTYAPVAIPTSTPVGAGYFVAARDAPDLRAGQRLVVRGAALLYSASRSAHPAGAASAPADDD